MLVFHDVVLSTLTTLSWRLREVINRIVFALAFIIRCYSHLLHVDFWQFNSLKLAIARLR